MRDILNSLQSHDTYFIQFCPLLSGELNLSIVQDGCPGDAKVSGFQILPRYSFKSFFENGGLSSHVISPKTWLIQSQIIVHHLILDVISFYFHFFKPFHSIFISCKKIVAKLCMCYSQVKTDFLMTGFYTWLDLQWEGVFKCCFSMCTY